MKDASEPSALDTRIQLPTEPNHNSHLGYFLGLVLCGLVVLLGLSIAVTFFQAQQERVHQGANVNLLLEGSVTRTLESVEIALLGLLEREQEMTGDVVQPALQEAIDKTLRFSPHIRQILLTRGEQILVDSRPGGVGQSLDVARLQLRPADLGGFNLGIRIGNPLPGRFLPTQGQPSITRHHSQVLPVAMALRDAEGESLEVYAALNPGFFLSSMNRVELGNYSGSALLGLDGVPLVAEPPLGDWPGSIAATLQEQLQGGEESGYLPLDGGRFPGQQVAYRLSARYPLAVLVLIDHRDTLSAWWQRSRYLLLASALVILGLFLAGGLLLREIQHRFHFQGEARLLGQAVTQSATAVLVTNPTGQVIYANSAYTQLAGFSAEEVLGKPLGTLFNGSGGPASDRDWFEAQLPWNGECQIRVQDGRLIWVLLSISPVHDQQGCISHWICTQVDITERKEAEEELRIAATAFESQEGMLVTDAQGVILRVNRAFCELTGYQNTEVVGKTPAVLKSGYQDQDFYNTMWQSLLHHHHWQGELWNRRKDGEVYPEWLTISGVQNEHGDITHYVGSFTDISQRKAAEAEIQRLAFFDALTGLPNRRLLMDRLHHALAASARSGDHGALLFIDLDNFKTLNDTRGHQVGDKLLTEVANRLRTCVRELDTVARLGGDEFVVILEGLNRDRRMAATRAEQVALKILQRLQKPHALGNYEHHGGASVGVNLFHGHEVGIDDLLKRADVAMYRAKAAGRNTIRLFDPTMQATLEARADLEQALRRALPEGQLQLHLQPQIHLDLGVIGAEALLRWQHPEMGLVSPAEFIPLAEESGLIVPIGYWVIATACDYLRHWQQHPQTRHLSLAVNVSAWQFRQRDFVHRVLELVEKRGIDPGLLKLELTESLMLDDVKETIHRMRALRRAGIRLAVDDFGTGQSSLAYLKTLPLDQLKIDASFVRDLPTDAGSAAITQTIIAMAEGLNLEVIAEGVETPAQAKFLSHHGCRAFQGYLYGRPVEESAFREMLFSEYRFGAC